MILGSALWPCCVTLRPILALVMLVLISPCDPRTCDVLTWCMGYRAPQMG
jgi:hypothetical protein